MVSVQYGQFFVLKDRMLAIVVRVSFILNAATVSFPQFPLARCVGNITRHLLF